MAPILGLKDASLTFGTRPIFNMISLFLDEGDRACLVGRNGEGKTTLLNILAGLQELDKGERQISLNTHLAYVPQIPFFDHNANVADFVAEGLDAHETNDPHFSAKDDYRIQMMMDVFKMRPDQKLSELSGGESRRVALAKALIAEPNILLLDEPTNHLDIDAILWLETYLINFKGAILVISHDRSFLKKITNKTFWLDRGQLRTQSRGYQFFDEWMDDIYRIEEQTLHKMDQKIKSELLWLREGLSARRKRDQGRLRKLNNLRTERREHLHRKTGVKLEASEGKLGGKAVCDVIKLSKSFGDLCIVDHFDLEIQRKDRIGIVGPNGIGKTSFLKLLLGELTPDQGKIKWGVGIEPLYFDQKRNQLDENLTLWQTLCPTGGDYVSINGKPKHVVGYLKDFLFDEKQAHHYVKTLSGGEKNRLLLAKLFTQPSNIIILDEPTNDLDMETLDLLEEMIANYEGTIIIVSHDRDFLDQTTTYLLAFEGKGKISIFVGGYSDYLQKKWETEKLIVSKEKASKQKPTEKKENVTQSPKVKLSYNDQRDLKELPGKIDQLNISIKTLEKKLQDPYLYSSNPSLFAETSAQLEKTQKQAHDAEERLLHLLILEEELYKK